MEDKELEDKELLCLLIEQPSKGIEAAMEAYGGAAKKICCAYLPGCAREDLEETISDCFVALWQNAGKFEKERGISLRSYFYGIARRTAMNRRRRLLEEGKYDSLVEEDTSTFPDPFLTEEVVENKLLAEMVRDMIGHMQPPDDEIFRLRYLSQYSEKEIAAQLKMTVKAIERRIARGRKKLKKQFMESGLL